MILIQEEVAPKRYKTSLVRGGPLYREDNSDWVVVEFVDSCLERLKVICYWEDGRKKRVPVSKCHRDKRVGECVCTVSI